MTGAQLKDFIEQVYFHLNDMVSAGKISVDDRILLGPMIIQTRLEKEALEI